MTSIPSLPLRSGPHDDDAEIDKKSPGEREPAEPRALRRRRLIGLGVGVALAVIVYLVMPADAAHPVRLTAATAVLMGVWWMTEAIPIPATALVPLVVFPVFNSEVTVDRVGASYGNNIIFLFMGGFLLALAMQRWNLHRRIALRTVSLMGTRPPMVIAGFMIATAFLSMWVSNTATAVMMIPIGVSVLVLVARLAQQEGTAAAELQAAAAGSPLAEGAPRTEAETKEMVRKSPFGTALMLGIAYAASLGSVSTIIGTPPNALLVGYLQENHGITIGFGQWMLAGVPLSALMLIITWFLLTKVIFRPEIDDIPGGSALIRAELEKLGPMSSGEIRVGVVFILAAVSWVFVPLIADGVGLEAPPITDAGIAMTIGLILFLMPAGAERGVRLLDWPSALKLPWGVLLLFGGGLALSGQFTTSGLTDWIGTRAGSLDFLPVLLIVAVTAAAILFLTEITSNTATAATFLPVAGGVAMGMGLDPLLLTIPVALSATCAFMLPVATPPNAVAYGTGYVTIGSMIKGGIWLNLIAIVLVTLFTYTVFAWVLGATL